MKSISAKSENPQHDPKHDKGVPDWRGATGYPDQGSPIDHWRWEFIRRREDYRLAWADMFDASQAHWDAMEAAGALGSGTHRSDYLAVAASRISHEAAIRFGVAVFRAPWKKYSPMSLPPLFEQSYGFLYLPEDGRVDARLSEESQVLVAFDLSKPIDAQLEKARQMLIAYSESGVVKQGRLRTDRWSDYLRITDAFDSGIGADDIAKELYPDVNNEYPDFAGRRRVLAARKKAESISDAFAIKGYIPPEK